MLLIRSASSSGSMTPFRSLLWSKPPSESAWTVTVTVPAISARLATAFHAVNNWFLSAVNVNSTRFCLDVSGSSCGVGPDGDGPGTGPPADGVGPDGAVSGLEGAAWGTPGGMIRKPESRSISSAATAGGPKRILLTNSKNVRTAIV